MPSAAALARTDSSRTVSTAAAAHTGPGAPSAHRATIMARSLTRSTSWSRMRPQAVAESDSSASAPSTPSSSATTTTSTAASSAHRPPSQATPPIATAPTPPRTVTRPGGTLRRASGAARRYAMRSHSSVAGEDRTS